MNKKQVESILITMYAEGIHESEPAIKHEMDLHILIESSMKCKECQLQQAIRENVLCQKHRRLFKYHIKNNESDSMQTVLEYMDPDSIKQDW